MSGVAVGELGTNLGSDARDVPRGADLCAYQESLGQPSPNGTDKSMSEACKKATKSDKLWRKSMAVLGAYSGKLEDLAWGANADLAGKLEGATTGVTDPNWTDADGPDETAARDAVNELAKQLRSNASKGDLGDTIKQAAPHVKTICDGLGKYLDTQLKTANDAETEVDKRRTSHNDRRCASLDGKNVCVQESVLDRMTYAGAFANLEGISASHADARDTLSEFCAAHAKLEEAANAGNLGKDKTYDDIVEAVAGAPRAGGGGAAPATKPADAKPGDAKPEK
jgi:hypothetical protein